MRYIAKTDGLRNNLYERIFVTNSPRYEEVLPTIANPPSLRQQEGKQVVWTVTEPETFRGGPRALPRIRSYGLDKIMQHSHEVTWRDEGDSNTHEAARRPAEGRRRHAEVVCQSPERHGLASGRLHQLH